MQTTKSPQRPRRTKLERLLDDSEKHAFEVANDKDFSTHIYYRQFEAGYLSISATTQTIPRAIDCFGDLIRRFEREGFSYTVDYKPTYHYPSSAVIIDSIPIPIRIKEKFAYVREKKKSFLDWSRQRIIPTNSLSFEIFDGSRPVRKIRDTGRLKLEERFDEIVSYLRKEAQQRKQEMEEAEQRRLQEEQRRRDELELKKRIQDRVDLAESILTDIYLYDKARVIREYCEKFRSYVPKMSEKNRMKLEVAESIANWIDPTVNYRDDLLAMEYTRESILEELMV